MQASPLVTMIRSLAPPGQPRIIHGAKKTEAGPKDTAEAEPVDFLFLYRTEKKRRYFSLLVGEALSGHRCMVASYHRLPCAPSKPLAPERMAMLLARAERELFHARDGHWSLALRPLLLRYRRGQITRMHARLHALLERVRPGAIVLWNGSKFQDWVLHEANHLAIPVLYFENGVLPGTTTVDPRGINAGNSVPRDPNRFRACAANAGVSLAPLKDRQRRYHFGRKARQTTASPKPSVDTLNILVPFQKERDTQMLEHSPWIQSMPQLVRELCKAIDISGSSACRLWLREHPSSATRYPALYRQVANKRHIEFANQGSLAHWLANMDVVVTVNSSVGLEALMLGKQVITLGAAFYNIPGLVDHADSAEQLAEALVRAQRKPPIDETLRRGFFSFLAGQYATEGDWREPDARHWQAVRARMLEVPRSGVRASCAEHCRHP